MAIEDARWYVIHTYSGYEAMVKDSLEKLIENNNLQENIFEIQIPTEETLEEKEEITKEEFQIFKDASRHNYGLIHWRIFGNYKRD